MSQATAPAATNGKSEKYNELMEKAREALSDLLAEVVDRDQPAAVIDLLTYDCDFTARDWNNLAGMARSHALDESAWAAEDRRIRRAEDGWRDA